MMNFRDWDDLVVDYDANWSDEDANIPDVDIPKTPRPLIDIPTGPKYLAIPGGTMEELKANPKKFEIKFRDKAINFASVNHKPKSDIFEHTRVKVKIIMKIGGAAISSKTQPDKLLQSELNKIVAHIAQVKNSWAKEVGIILVHGAGGFGHNHARQYGLSSGLARDNAILGFAKTRLAVTTLSNHVVESLISQNIPAVRVSPSAFMRTHDTKVSEVSFTRLNQHLQSTLNMGLIPVLHGDVMVDSIVGCSILSGDTIVGALTKAFRPRCCVFSTDTDGVFDRHPDLNGAQLVREIKVLENGTLDTSLSFDGDSKQNVEQQFDVTGQMETKVKTATSCASRGVDVFIVKGGSESELEILKTLKPPKSQHTWIHSVK